MTRYLKKLIMLGAIIMTPSILCAQNSFADNYQQRPSFDCQKAQSIIEKSICNNTELSMLDAQMGKLFALSKPPKFLSKSDLSFEQKAWLKQRNLCVKSKKLPIKQNESDCLKINYEERILELSQGLSLNNFELAKDGISKYAPEQLPYYNAINHYFTIRVESERNLAINKDLGVEFEKLNGEYETYVKGIMSDSGINSIDDALVDDAKFGTFISLLSSIDAGSIVIPCQAFIEKPELISAISPYFGSTRDNFLARSDCQIPSKMTAFKGFIEAGQNAAPQCDGTIRFAIYKSHQLHIEEILLGRFKEIHELANFYRDYLSNKSQIDAGFTKFIKTKGELQKSAAREIKAFWDAQYPNHGLSLHDIEDSLAALALGDFIDC